METNLVENAQVLEETAEVAVEATEKVAGKIPTKAWTVIGVAGGAVIIYQVGKLVVNGVKKGIDKAKAKKEDKKAEKVDEMIDEAIEKLDDLNKK